MWEYTRATGWQSIENLFTSGGFVEDQLAGAGYAKTPSLKWEARDGDLSLEVNCRIATAEQGYLVDVTIGDRYNMVRVPTLPDLLALLRELAPVFAADAQLTAQAAK